VSILTTIVDEILKLNGPPAYALVGGLSFAEAAIFVGFVLPGETAVLLGGVLANQQRVSLTGIAIIAVLGAVIGDSVGYEVGRRYGSKILATRLFARRQGGIDRGKRMLNDYGGRAVFLSRFTAFLRAVMPGLAGTARLPYRRFLVFNAAGGVIWALGFTLLGYLVGASYRKVENIAGRASEIILGVIVLRVVLLVIRHRRRERDPAPAGATGAAGAPEQAPEPAPAADSAPE
jgi:membrane-associated protein